jgi:hypothetical protein
MVGLKEADLPDNGNSVYRRSNTYLGGTNFGEKFRLSENMLATPSLRPGGSAVFKFIEIRANTLYGSNVFKTNNERV